MKKSNKVILKCYFISWYFLVFKGIHRYSQLRESNEK
jgi:hypothetical protein